jgi:hypothetical protein
MALSDSLPDTPPRLKARLAAEGRDWLLLTSLPAPVAEVVFVGDFQGREVVFRMRLATLTHYVEERGPLSYAGGAVRGVMDLEAQGPECWRAWVGLAVPVIDEPVVRKAIIMMRNYRALRPGLRVWGDSLRG